MNIKLNNSGKSFLSKLIMLLPESIVQNIFGIRLIIPCWHAVCDYNTEYLHSDTRARSLRSFLDDLDYFLRIYNPVDIDDIINHFNGMKVLKKNSFLPTFDDGLKEFHDIIAPILLKKGIKAIFFISTSCVDNKELIYPHKISLLIRHIKSSDDKLIINKINHLLIRNKVPGINILDRLKKISYNKRSSIDKIAEIVGFDFHRYLNEKKPYLTSHQINSLIKVGFEIGSHSIDHPRFSEICIEEQIRQVKESSEWLSNTFNINCRTFAFPFADDNVADEFYQMAANMTNIKIVMGSWGILQFQNIRNLKRLLMDSDIYQAKVLIFREIFINLKKKLF